MNPKNSNCFLLQCCRWWKDGVDPPNFVAFLSLSFFLNWAESEEKKRRMDDVKRKFERKKVVDFFDSLNEWNHHHYKGPLKGIQTTLDVCFELFIRFGVKPIFFWCDYASFDCHYRFTFFCHLVIIWFFGEAGIRTHNQGFTTKPRNFEELHF